MSRYRTAKSIYTLAAITTVEIITLNSKQIMQVNLITIIILQEFDNTQAKKIC